MLKRIYFQFIVYLNRRFSYAITASVNSIFLNCCRPKDSKLTIQLLLTAATGNITLQYLFFSFQNFSWQILFSLAVSTVSSFSNWKP